jgi:uncharacterized membrane protein (UPF0136 family)
MNPNTILWLYIVLLVAGGLIGFLKAKSAISLYMSIGFAAGLALCAVNGLLADKLARGLADVLMIVLLVVFGLRLAKTRKFMPSGMMLAVTIVALALRHL